MSWIMEGDVGFLKEGGAYDLFLLLLEFLRMRRRKIFLAGSRLRSVGIYRGRDCPG